VKTIPLTRGFVATIDDADYDKVIQYKWHARVKATGVYAVSERIPGKYLHRFLLPGVPQVDHRDGNGLNNSRGNLRASDNAANKRSFRKKSIGKTSTFRGVYWCRETNKWRAQIHTFGKHISLGRFFDETDAAKARDKKAKELWGEVAQLNFP